MDVFNLPFNKHIGIASADTEGCLLMLPERNEYLNHLGTVHASAQFALAEATSGFFLLNEFRKLTNILPVVRKVETKYKKPAQGIVFSKAHLLDSDKQQIIEELSTKKRALIKVRVLIFDANQNNVMQSDFEWFVSKLPDE